MPYKEKVIEKKYFSIGEVAEMLDVATSLIRFWESEFDIIKPKKNRKGNRQFTKEDIENVKLIYHLVKEKGYTLQGAKDLLKNGNDVLKEKIEIIDSLKKIKNFLKDIRAKFA
jgi:DNA-binding transcriptional MerR regulator